MTDKERRPAFAVVDWTNTKTGKSGHYEEPLDHYGSMDFDDEETGLTDAQRVNDFMWREGNYSCDCNRSIFFEGREVGDATTCGSNYRIDKFTARRADGTPVEGYEWASRRS